MSPLTIAIQHYSKSFCQSDQERNKIKRHSNWKRRNKIIFADDIVLCIDNSKESTKISRD